MEMGSHDVVWRRSGYGWIKSTDMPGIVHDEICFDRIISRWLEADCHYRFEITFGENILHLVAQSGLAVVVFDFELQYDL